MSGGHSDGYSFKNQYSGAPENNVKWVKVKDAFGKVWFGTKVSKVISELHMQYEFVRGPVPKSHQLDMKDYRGLNDEIDFDYKTFKEWKDKGYIVNKGEKSKKLSRGGDPLFHISQVKYLG